MTKNKSFYEEHKKELLEKMKIYYQNNKEKINNRNKEYYQKNKVKIKKYRAKWHQDNKLSKRLKHIKKKYGLTLDDYNNIFKNQNNKCAICHLNLPNGFNQNKCIDHNHQTGSIRGILCSKCNFVLGLVNDSQGILLSAVNYLKRYE